MPANTPVRQRGWRAERADPVLAHEGRIAVDFDGVLAAGAWSRRTLPMACLGGLFAGCPAEPDPVEREAGRTARIPDADSLALDTGLRGRLAEVEAPAAGHGDCRVSPWGGCSAGSA
jgi:hypothetical protein